MPRRILYSKSAFVFNPTPPTVTPSQLGFHVPWTAPVPSAKNYDPNVAEAWNPITFQAPTPLFGWFKSWESPTLRPPRTITVAEAWTPTNLPFQPPKFGWYSEWPDPVRTAPRFTETQTIWAPQPAPILPVTPTQLGWYTQWRDPVLKAEKFHQDGIAWIPQSIANAPIVAPFGWLAQWPDTTRPKWTDPNVTQSWAPTSLPFQNPPLGWLKNWEEPKRLAPSAIAVPQAWTPTGLPFQNPAFGWYRRFDEPVLRQRAALNIPISWTPQPFWNLGVTDEGLLETSISALPVSSKPMPFYLNDSAGNSWLIAATGNGLPETFSVTASAYPVLQGLESVDGVPWNCGVTTAGLLFTAAILSFGWYRQWDAPVRSAQRAIDPANIWSPQKPPNLPVTPSQFGFWARWNDPVLALRRTPDSIAWCPLSIALPSPPFGWFTRWLEPLLAARRLAEGSIAWTPQSIANVIIVPPPFGWFVRWNDPRFKKESFQVPETWTPQPITFIPSVVPPFGWLSRWNDPQFVKKSFQVAEAWAPHPIIFVPPATPPFGWYVRWNDPQFCRQVLQTIEAWTPTALSFQPPKFGWFRTWEAPRFTKLPLNVAEAWTPQIVPFVPSVVPPFGWNTQWRDVIRRIPFNPNVAASWDPQHLDIYKLIAILTAIVPEFTASLEQIIPKNAPIAVTIAPQMDFGGIAAINIPSVELRCIALGIVGELLACGGQLAFPGSSLVAFELNDQFITVFGLSRALQAPNATPDWVTDATGIATLYDELGNVVAGPLNFSYQAGPIVMPNGATSPGGNYAAPLPASFNAQAGSNYLCKITLTSGSGGTFHVEQNTSVQIRRS